MDPSESGSEEGPIMINVALKSQLVKQLTNNIKTAMGRRTAVVCAKLDAPMVSLVMSSERYVRLPVLFVGAVLPLRGSLPETRSFMG